MAWQAGGFKQHLWKCAGMGIKFIFKFRKSCVFLNLGGGLVCKNGTDNALQIVLRLPNERGLNIFDVKILLRSGI